MPGLDEPLTPVEIEQRLRRSITLLTQAQQALAAARDTETEAELDYKRAHYAAVLDPECPKPGRGAGDSTVGERDAWVAQRTHDAFRRYKFAETAREAAQDHLRTVRDVSSILQSLGASVRQAYGMAGHS